MNQIPDERERTVLNAYERKIFVRVIRNYSVVLNRSMRSKTVAAKEQAWKEIQKEFDSLIGKQTSVIKLKKLLNNMKTDLKKRMENNTSGSLLLEWETEFFSLLQEFEKNKQQNTTEFEARLAQNQNNESKPEVKGENDSSYGCNYDDDDDDYSPEIPSKRNNTIKDNYTTKHNKKLRSNKKPAVNDGEVAGFSNLELQKTVLNEQIKLIKLKKEKEQIKIMRQKIKLEKETLEFNQLQQGNNVWLQNNED